MSKLTKSVLIRLARDKVAAARALLDAGCYTDAYYIVGYAVECALKAKIADEFEAHTIPDKKRVLDIYVHDLGKLANLAGLVPALEKKCRADPAFKQDWDIVRAWDSQSRYVDHSVEEAYALFDSVDGASGVLAWILSFV
jgi:hypothetical protein